MIARALLWMIRLYQLTLSPLLGTSCRFHPSCSRFTATCIERFGPARGLWLGCKRLARCQPFCAGGYDPPPDSFSNLATTPTKDPTTGESSAAFHGQP